MSRAESQSPFDPFSIADEEEPGALISGASQSTHTSKTKNTTTTKESKSKAGSTAAKPLPPRINVKVALHEEISSTAVVDKDADGGVSMSQLSIEGSVTAQIESSNAKENSPFHLQITGPMASLANIRCKDYCSLYGEDPGKVQCRVNIPKSEKVGYEVLNYTMSVRTQNMPILVQAKSTVKDNKCRIIVQIRSNLSNEGDLSNFTIIVAIPTTLLAETVKITRGEGGMWDATKSIITWKIGTLPHGESCLVSAEADVRMSPAVKNVIHDNPFTSNIIESKIHCPVMIRCSSTMEHISDMALSVVGPGGKMAQNTMSSYQLLHRVGGKTAS